MEAIIESGRDGYSLKNFSRALRQFTRAMHLCPCNNGRKRKRCSCKDYEAVANTDGSVLPEAMHNCVCGVRQTFGLCSNQLHVQALDYRAATFEAMGSLDRAMKDATWMMELAPHLPNGYLRAGKVARLQQNAWLAWKIYSAGVEATKDNVIGSQRKSKLYAALQQLQMRFKRRDPMCLPLEIVHVIFSHMDTIILTRCLLVSRAWKQTLESRDSQSLWRRLVFPRPPPRPVTVMALKSLVARSGGEPREVVIHTTSRALCLEQKLTTLITHSKNLERLDLVPGPPFYCIFSRIPRSYPRLRHLSLVSDNFSDFGENRTGAKNNPMEFVRNVAGTLESLNLNCVPSWANAHDIPDFPNLKVLRLSHKPSLRSSLPVFFMASKTVRLEQLHLDNVHIDSNHMDDETRKWSTLWAHLKVLVFILPRTGSPAQLGRTVRNLTLLNSVLCGQRLVHLDLDMPWSDKADEAILTDEIVLSKYGLADTSSQLAIHHNRFLNLRSLCSHEYIAIPEKMGVLLGESVRTGKLHNLDIVFPLDGHDGPVGQQSMRHLAAYGWLRGLESIRSIGLSQFRFCQHPLSSEDNPLPGFLASFPNLTTLSIDSEHYQADELWSVVKEIMQVTRLKTIYQSRIHGVPLDQLLELARQQGVTIERGWLPRQWPLQLES